MNINIEQSWEDQLHKEFEKPYFSKLLDFVDEEYGKHTCYPKEEDIFAAFNYCTFDEVKVVIIGQDPYHGPNQANGLCFSVKEGMKHPPSLVNIFKEIEADIGKPYPLSGNLKAWANQGVLLLNATLTVRAHEAASHQNKGWEIFTDSVIQAISKDKKNVLFLLWGSFAKKKTKLIDTSLHHILTSGHPSPLSANRGYWFRNAHFSAVNTLLKASGKQIIDW